MLGNDASRFLDKGFSVREGCSIIGAVGGKGRAGEDVVDRTGGF